MTFLKFWGIVNNVFKKESKSEVKDISLSDGFPLVGKVKLPELLIDTSPELVWGNTEASTALLHNGRRNKITL